MTTAAALPKVLLLGDSIRMSYQPRVTELLAGRAEVTGPGENCCTALYTSMRLNAWLQAAWKPDFVHWNNGIHDCGRNPERGPEQFTIADYLRNLRTVLDQLRATGAKIVWATMTPQHPERPCASPKWSWTHDEMRRYNDAALELMTREGLPVNDLRALVLSDPDTLLADDRLHLSPIGVERSAQAVASAIERVMATRAVPQPSNS
jgi:lysophospholipase L1-like esterase